FTSATLLIKSMPVKSSSTVTEKLTVAVPPTGTLIPSQVITPPDSLPSLEIDDATNVVLSGISSVIMKSVIGTVPVFRTWMVYSTVSLPLTVASAGSSSITKLFQEINSGSTHCGTT